MTRVRVVTWNAEGMFVAGTKTRRATPHDALETLKKLNADIVVIPEFGDLTAMKDEVRVAIHALGYEIVTLAYDEPRSPGLGFAVLSRLPVMKRIVHVLEGSKRQLLEVEVICEHDAPVPLRVFGVHLDDRTEEGRLTEVGRIVDILNQYDGQALLLVGDFNAMHKDAWFARAARSRLAGSVSRRIPHALVRSMAMRVHQMAFGTTIAYLLQHTHLHDLDPRRSPTISARQAGMELIPSWRLAKIDWMFASSPIQTIRYRVMKDIGSDHRPVVADLNVEYTKQ